MRLLSMGVKSKLRQSGSERNHPVFGGGAALDMSSGRYRKNSFGYVVALVLVLAAIQWARYETQRSDFVSRLGCSGPPPEVIIFAEPGCARCARCLALMVGSGVSGHLVLNAPTPNQVPAAVLVEIMQSRAGFTSEVATVFSCADEMKAIQYYLDNPELVGLGKDDLDVLWEECLERVQLNTRTLAKFGVNPPAVLIHGSWLSGDCEDTVFGHLR